MKRIHIVLTILVFTFLVGITGCGVIKNVIESDPLGDMLLATVSGTLEVATPEVPTSNSFETTPVPTVDHGPFILMLDDFSDPDSGWEVSNSDYGHSAYEDGTYIVEAIQAKNYNWGIAGKNYENVRIEVDAAVLQTNSDFNDAFGVDCRIQENGDGYGFRISSDGFATIELFSDTELVELMEWIESDAIYTDGRTNHITAICEGDHFSLLVNDINVADVVDDTFTQGDIALSAISFTDEPITVAYDDIVVQEIGNPYEYADQETYSVIITNPTTFDACNVFIGPTTETSWGYSLMDEGAVIAPGESMTFNDFTDSLVDIMVESCQTLRLYEGYGVDLSTNATIDLVEPHVLLQQPFTDTEGWPSGVVDGGLISNTRREYYSVAVSEADKLVTANSDFIGSDVIVQTNVSLVSAGSNNLGIYGVTCRMQPDRSGIFFAVRGDGMGSIMKIRGGQLLSLSDWQIIENFDDLSTLNYIEGDCIGSTYTLLVNGDYLDSVDDNEFKTGEAGVAVYSPAGETTQADFDYLNVYAAE